MNGESVPDGGNGSMTGTFAALVSSRLIMITMKQASMLAGKGCCTRETRDVA